MNLVDTLLDRAVVPGYTKIGYALRRRGCPADYPRSGSLAGKRCLVTGAGGVLGRQTALDLARLGGTVHLLVRNEVKGRAALDELAAAVPAAELHLEVCDVSSLASVRAFAADFAARVDALHVLVHNAGVLPPRREESPEGHEITLATHVLGPVLMTELLLSVLAAGHGRVVLVSSGGMYGQRLPADDLEYNQGDYSGTTAYARTKRVQVTLTPLLQQRWAHAGVQVHAMHPGWADTPGVTTSLPLFAKMTGPLLRDAAQGADTVVWLAATEPPPTAGRFWHDREPRPTHYVSAARESETDRDRVLREVLDDCGLQ